MKTIKIAGVIASVGCASTMMAQTSMQWQLRDLNTTALVDSQQGMIEWRVDNSANLLLKQWFYFRAGEMTGRASVGSLQLESHSLGDNLLNPGYETLQATYNGVVGQSRFQVSITYTLNGRPTGGGADMGEIITVSLLEGPTIPNFSLVQYSDFNLGPSETVTFPFPNYARQTGTVGILSETVVGPPMPAHHEGGLAADLLAKVAGGGALNDNVFAGPGDVAWAFEWNFDLTSSGYQVSKDKQFSFQPVPDSGTTVALLGLAVAGLAFLRRRMAH